MNLLVICDNARKRRITITNVLLTISVGVIVVLFIGSNVGPFILLGEVGGNPVEISVGVVDGAFAGAEVGCQINHSMHEKM